MWNLIAGIALFLRSLSAGWPFRSRRLRFQLTATNVAIDCYAQSRNHLRIADLVPDFLMRADELYKHSPTPDVQAQVLNRKAQLAVILIKNTGSQTGQDWIEDALSWFRETPSPDDRLWGACYLDLASVLLELNRDPESLEWLEKAATARTKAHGPDSFEVGQCHANLCVAYQGLGRYGESELAAQEALRIYEKLKLNQHIGMTLNNLAGTLIKAERSEEAIPLVQRAIKCCEYDPALLAEMLDTQADVYEAVGHNQPAILSRGRALAIAWERRFWDKYVEWSEKQIAMLGKLGREEEAEQVRLSQQHARRAGHFLYSQKENAL